MRSLKRDEHICSCLGILTLVCPGGFYFLLYLFTYLFILCCHLLYNLSVLSINLLPIIFGGAKSLTILPLLNPLNKFLYKLFLSIP